MTSHISDLAAEHSAFWRDEITRQRAADAHLIPDDVPPVLTPYCSRCQGGTKAYVCGACQREDDSNQREDGAA
jgi:hypothetical protein